MTFLDRVDAGRQLSRLVERLGVSDLVVLGLPRGGVPVADEVARSLGAPLDVIVVRKVGVPDQPELAMGAIGEGDVRILNERVLRLAGITPEVLAATERQERDALTRRVQALRGGREPTTVAGRTVVIVDDGIATGSTARAACQVARARGARRVILAVPVAASDAVDMLRADADEVVSVLTPDQMFSISEWYVDFTPTTDEEVQDLLASSAGRQPEDAAAAWQSGEAGNGDDARYRYILRSGFDEDVLLSAGTARLPGRLVIPEGTDGVVVFAHGSGSSRHSPRTQFVASMLHDAGLGTLLFDLLTPDEEADRGNVFDVELLAGRLAQATRWLRTQPRTEQVRIGWFGASTGAAAALWAAADPAAEVAAIVSRGGRPDLAGSRLPSVRAPTLLIVGGLDSAVLELNREAQARLQCRNELVVVPGATHLFEEPGTLAEAAEAAAEWFGRHLHPVTHESRGRGR
jgi:putative phosphoribosyl transferase